jgi:predicted phosphodiesterase
VLSSIILAVALSQVEETRIAFLGDQGLGSDSRAVLQLVLDEGAHAIVHLGDFDYEDDPAAWRAQLDGVLPPCFPYFAVAGNHDESEFEGYRAVIEGRLACTGVPWQGDAGDRYALRFRGIYLVLTTPGLLGGGDAEYVAARLASPEAQAAAWRVSGWHLLMRNLQVGGKGDESGWPVYENSRLGGAIIATGHEHSYERTNLLSDMSEQAVAGTELVVSEGETFAFVSGLGGQSIRDQERCLPASPPYGCNGTWASIYASDQGADYGAAFLVFNDQGDPCRARGYFKSINGEVADEYVVTSRVGPCAGGGPAPCDCALDLTGDCAVDAQDVAQLFQDWGAYDVRDLLLLLQGWGTCGAEPPAPGPQASGIWISPDELMQLPMSGAAWNRLASVAAQPAGTPDVSDQHEDADVRTMAKALYAERTGDEAMREEVRALVMSAIGTEDGVIETLALGKNLAGYVIAADLVGLGAAQDAAFRGWIAGIRHLEVGGRTLVSTHDDRPNNWGTLCGAARMAIDLYLGDRADFDAAAAVFAGWLDGSWPHDYGDLCWQADPAAPRGVNPPGSVLAGIDVDGVLPDDQRRSLLCPPDVACENYAWTALQGAVVQAALLSRHGYPQSWQWSDQALRRALRWLHEEAGCPAAADDGWIPPVVNSACGTSFPASTPTGLGKNVDFTDWTHGD